MFERAVIAADFACLEILTRDATLRAIRFAPLTMPLLAPPPGSLAAEVARQLRAYQQDPHWRFDLPCLVDGSAFQRRVWAQIARIPCGEVRTYGEVAASLGSAARAVGGACGRNPLPIVVPCHRVVAAQGLGGFNRSTEGSTLGIKEWLLAHERSG